jgi:DNA-binding MarR family transcriptional regulator
LVKRNNIPDLANEEKRQQQQKHVLRAMKRIMVHFRLRVDEQLRPQGVTAAQIQVLFAVRNAPASSGAQLARSCYITPQTTQALLKHLEKGGFIMRGKDPVNDRIVTLTVTPAGDRLLHSVEKTVQKLQDELWDGVSDRELGQFNHLLEHCMCNLGIASEFGVNCR